MTRTSTARKTLDRVGKSTTRFDGYRSVGSCGRVADWCTPCLEDDFCVGCPINTSDIDPEEEAINEALKEWRDANP